MLRFLSLLLFLIGFVLLITASILIFERISPLSLAFASLPSSSMNQTKFYPKTKASFKPAEIIIPSLPISLPITYATITHGQWQTSMKGVSYLVSSQVPGEMGNAIFYGHNFPNLLGKLDHVQVGDLVSIKDTQQTVRTFRVSEKKVVEPTEISVLAQTSDIRITVYTCTGFLDSQRLIIVAKLVI